MKKFEKEIIKLFAIAIGLLFTDLRKDQIIIALVIVLIGNLAGMIYSAVGKKNERKKRNVKKGSFRPKKTNFKKKGGKK